MKRLGLPAAAATMLAAAPAWAQASEPLRLGLLLDLSGVYADMTGPGSKTAVDMAVADLAASC